MSYTMHPLFCDPVCTINTGMNVDGLLTQHAKTVSYESTNKDESKGSYQSTNTYILEDFPEHKQNLLSIIQGYAHDVLKWDSAELCITTSWFTLTDSSGYSSWHNHKNSLLSAVLYGSDDCSPIEFANLSHPETFLIKPFETNIYNSQQWWIRPEKGTLVIFPSYMYHRISHNKTDSPRYSLALNTLPTGRFGGEDSTACIHGVS